MINRRGACVVFAVIAAITWLPVASAGTGGSGTSSLENFEAFVVANGDAKGFNIANNILDNTTIAAGQGPNLIVPGLKLLTNAGFQWNGAGWHGQPSKDLNSIERTITIDFVDPAQMMSVDITAFSGFADTFTATVYAANDSTILDTFSSLPLSGTVGSNGNVTSYHFSYSTTDGMGKVSLTSGGQGWSPLIDNVSFGALPEPSMIAASFLLFIARGRRRG
jgi:hypothetical protein